MEIVLILCITIVAIIVIVGTLSTIEQCNYNKYKASNPEAFKDDED